MGTFTLGGLPIAAAFDGVNVWVTSYSGGTVTKLRASDGAIAATYTLGTGVPNLLGIAFDGANMWIADRSSSDITKLRASDGAVLGTFALPLGPYGVAFDGWNIWVTGASAVSELRADGKRIGDFFFKNTAGIAFDGANIWVATTFDSALNKL
jgi:DNA-binding beta-propeller fold protein YncE